MPKSATIIINIYYYSELNHQLNIEFDHFDHDHFDTLIENMCAKKISGSVSGDKFSYISICLIRLPI